MNLAFDTSYNNYTFKLPIPGRGKGVSSFIVMTEDHARNLAHVSCNLGKAGTIENAWAYGMAEIINLLIDSNISLDEIIAKLSGISTERYVETANTICRSGPEAFAIAFREYRKLKEIENESEAAA